MPDDSLITDEMRSWLGRGLDRRTLEVEKGAIRRFAEAVGDPNPLWRDEDRAKASRFGGLIAPPTFLRLATPPPEFPFPIAGERVLDGGSEWEWREAVRPGDVITAVTRLTDLYERQGRVGRMLFLVQETVYVNQDGRTAAVQRSTTIRY